MTESEDGHDFAKLKAHQRVRSFRYPHRVKEENVEARAAGRQLIEEGKAAGPKRKTFVFVNNRLEVNAIETMVAPGNEGSA